MPETAAGELWRSGTRMRASDAIRLGAGFLVVVTLVVTTGCKRGPSGRSQTAATHRREAPSEASARPDVQLRDDVRRGVCLAHNWQDGGIDGYGTEESRSTLEHLRELGVDTISLTPFGWMSDLESPRVRGEHVGDLPDGGEDRTAMAEVVDQAHALDLRVILKPHIWIHGGKWRGRIEPIRDGEEAWSAWWDSYREFALYYARLAEKHDVETYVIGVELGSAIEARPDRFDALVDDVRDVYTGHVTYSANWNETLADERWRQLDSVGVQFYPPLTDADDPSVATLRSELRPRLAKWNERAHRLDLPLDITEVGYKSAETSVERPSGWPQDLEEGQREVDRQLQARAYRALFAELRELSQLRSVSVWKYFTDPNRDEGGKVGFSPREKPAEDVLRRAYRR